MSDAASSLTGTLMEAEALEAPRVIARMPAANKPVFARIAARLRADPPALVVTCARGSSDHAATYARYLFETLTGTPSASAAPLVALLYPTTVMPPARDCAWRSPSRAEVPIF